MELLGVGDSNEILVQSTLQTSKCNPGKESAERSLGMSEPCTWGQEGGGNAQFDA